MKKMQSQYEHCLQGPRLPPHSGAPPEGEYGACLSVLSLQGSPTQEQRTGQGGPHSITSSVSFPLLPPFSVHWPSRRVGWGGLSTGASSWAEGNAVHKQRAHASVQHLGFTKGHCGGPLKDHFKTVYFPHNVTKSQQITHSLGDTPAPALQRPLTCTRSWCPPASKGYSPALSGKS